MAQDHAKAIDEHDFQFGKPFILPARFSNEVNITPPNPNQPSSSSAVPVKVKSNFLSPHRTEEITGDNAANSDVSGVDVAAINGLIKLRVSVGHLVDSEIMRLRSARHEAFSPVANISLHLEEEKERLKHVNRKQGEKQASYDRAVVEYEQARAVLLGAQDEGEPTATTGQTLQRKNFATTCESLVNSWYKHVELARKHVMAWDFKCKRQAMVLTKVNKKLSSADAKYRASCAQIDADVEDFQAVTLFLMHLDE